MKYGIRKKSALLSLTAIFASLVLVAGTLGCAANMKQSAKPGAQLWGENCGRCHNIRPPQSYSDGEWEVVTMHMRGRANLSGEEAEKILEFLQMSN